MLGFNHLLWTHLYFYFHNNCKNRRCPRINVNTNHISPDEHAHFPMQDNQKTTRSKTNACSQTHKAYAPDISLYIVQLL
uniref:Putative ovule protein n=1 Tax=Solanum chacoense TaxID=4108 RepID=A0A0V0H0B2_SOLCH